MRFLIVAFWVISVIGYMYNLFTTYGNMTPHISLPLAGSFVSKDVYFFGFTGIFMAFTYVFYFLNKIIKRLPNQFYMIPNKRFWLASKENEKALVYLLINWNYLFAIVINYFCMYLMLILESENHFEGETSNGIEWFYKPGFVMLGSLILPFFRLLVSKANLTEREEE